MPDDQLLQLSEAVIKGCFLTGFIVKTAPGILFFSVIKKP
jgi:hypothetical protein